MHERIERIALSGVKRSPYGTMVRTSRRGVAMVSTTLDFAEKYLLKTEVRTVAVMPDDDDSVRDDDSYDA